MDPISHKHIQQNMVSLFLVQTVHKANMLMSLRYAVLQVTSI